MQLNVCAGLLMLHLYLYRSVAYTREYQHLTWFVQGSIDDVFRFSTFCVEFVCYVALLLMNLLPEPRSTVTAYSILQDDVTEVGKYVQVLKIIH